MGACACFCDCERVGEDGGREGLGDGTKRGEAKG